MFLFSEEINKPFSLVADLTFRFIGYGSFFVIG